MVSGGMGGESSHPAMGKARPSWEYRLRKYLLLLAMLVATVTYGAAFNPPGGVWQEANPTLDRIAGDPIILDMDSRRYLAFFYSNATAFASSLVVIVLVLVLAVLHERRSASLAPLRILRVVMVLDLFSLVGAYAAGALRDDLTAVYSLALLAVVALYLAVHMALAWREGCKDFSDDGAPERQRLRKVLMVLATFAVSVTYVAGLSTPGGFRDRAEGAHRPGDAVLRGGRLKTFLVMNTTAFVASLLIIVILLEKRLSFSQNVRSVELYGLIAITLMGLVGAYSAGSCRQADTTIFVNSLIAAVTACILLQAAAIRLAIMNSCLSGSIHGKVSGWMRRTKHILIPDLNTGNAHARVMPHQAKALEDARSLALLLATPAAASTYQAGLNPPGGLWQADGNGYKAGDPILLTMSPRQYNGFYYCNTVAFVASLAAIVLARTKALHGLQAAMILDLFGLIGAYAAGSWRDVTTCIYAMALAGTVLVYVVIHIFYFTLHGGSTRRNDQASVDKERKDAESAKKQRKRLLLFAILAATITYQAGLTPPGGFLLRYRYTAFFYCNSVTLALSIALIILLVSPTVYRPSIQSNAFTVCTAVGMIGIMGAYAAGSTQHRKTSIYIFALAAFVLSVVILLVVLFLVIDPGKGNKKKNKTAEDEATQEGRSADEEATQEGGNSMEADPEAQKPDVHVPSDMEAENGSETEDGEDEKKLQQAKRKYLMLLGILVAGITYQAGLAPPGGVWPANDGGHEAGDPVMHDTRRGRYLAFFYGNSASFVASVVVIVVLLLPVPGSLHKRWWLAVMNTTIVLDLLGLLVAYAAGSSRSWKTSGYVSALVITVVAYFAIHVVLLSRASSGVRRGGTSQPNIELQPAGTS